MTEKYVLRKSSYGETLTHVNLYLKKLKTAEGPAYSEIRSLVRIFYCTSSIPPIFMDNFSWTISTHKIVGTDIEVRKSVMFVGFTARNKTFYDHAYCKTLKKLRQAFRNKIWGLFSDGFILLPI